MLCAVLVFGTIITGLIRSPLRRQEAQNNVDILLENDSPVAVVSKPNSIGNE
jgi:hypothetical protein